jgi:hypothetical protein
MKSKLWALIAVFLGSLLSPAAGSATVIGACEIDLPGLCTKSLDINAAGTQITIVLTNTSPSSDPGFITADAFNIPGNLGVTLFSTTNPNFQLVTGPIAVSPFPDTEFLLTATGSVWLGGGSPNGGIPGGGGSATFVLNVTGGTLTEADESAVFSSELIRLRGFTGNPDSDKDPVTIAPSPVPEPSALILLGIGLIITATVARQKSRRA